MGKIITQCFITITWVFCLTYLITSLAYRNSLYVYKFKGVDEQVQKYVCIQCLLTTIMALICSVFVEFEVIHIFGPIFISIPLGLVVPVISLCTLRSIKAAIGFDEKLIVNAVTKHWNTNKKVLPLLAAIQRDQKCCGLYSPFDYREFIYDNECENIPEDVPDSCADFRSLLDKCSGSPRQNDFCFVHKVTRDSIRFKNQTLNDMINNLSFEDRYKYKCGRVNSTIADINNSIIERKGIVYSTGCMENIISNNQALRDSHYFFFFLVIILVWSILISYLTFWYDNSQKARRKIQAEEENDLKSHFKTIGYITES